MRAHHKHYVAPAPLPPDLFQWDSPAPLGDEPVPRVVPFEKRVPGFPVIDPPAQDIDMSLQAAAKIAGHTSRIREAIFLWLKTQGSHGATAGEICQALGLSGSTVRPRLVELRGEAKWAPKLPRRISRTALRRSGMRIYEVIPVKG